MRKAFALAAVAVLVTTTAVALDVSRLEKEIEELTSKQVLDNFLPQSCHETLVVTRLDIQTTYAVKVMAACPEDEAALAEAKALGIVDPDAPPDH